MIRPRAERPAVFFRGVHHPQKENIMKLFTRVLLGCVFCMLVTAGAQAQETAETPEAAEQKEAAEAPAVQEAPAAAEAPASADVFTSDSSRFSYAFGIEIADFLRSLGQEIDLSAFSQGVKQAYNGEELVMTREKANEVKKIFMQKIQKERAEKLKKMAEDNLKASEEFMIKNKSSEGVKETASGLQYQIIKEGQGRAPVVSDTVTVHYKGTLVDGTEFDSSYKRGQAATFKLDQVIPGWTEGVQLIKEGGQIKLWLPSKLGYGERGAGPIPPNSVLVFEVELISVGEPNPAQASVQETPEEQPAEASQAQEPAVQAEQGS